MREIILKNAEYMRFPEQWRLNIRAWLEIIEADPEKLAFLDFLRSGLSDRDRQQEIAHSIRNYDETLGLKNTAWALLAMLWAMEDTRLLYAARGIPESIYYDTFFDINIWTQHHIDGHGDVGLYEVNWTRKHLLAGIFTLGRLQFEMKTISPEENSEYAPAGTHVLNVHVPRNGRLVREDCIASFREAERFFARYFPEYSYSLFICGSWLLDTRLQTILPQESNILQFQKLFTVAQVIDDWLQPFIFVFRCGTQDREKLQPKTHLEKALLERFDRGEPMGYGLGYAEKGKFGA